MSNFLKLVEGIPRGVGMATTDLPAIATDTILGNSTGSTATPTALSVASVLTLLGIKAGSESIGANVTSVSVTFGGSYAYASATGYAVTATMVNTTDSHAQYIPVTITTQSTTGFVCSWNIGTNTANYVLNWTAIVNN